MLPRLDTVLFAALFASAPSPAGRADEAHGPLPTNGDVERQLRFHTPAEADERRQRLIEFIWEDELPSISLATRDDVPRAEYGTALADLDLERVARVDRWSHTVTGLESVAWVLWPKSHRPARPRVAIVHQGHADRPNALSSGVGATIDRLLSRGVVVVAMQMPLYGWNDDRTALRPGTSDEIEIEGHADLFAKLAPPPVPNGAVFRVFLEPVIGAVDTALRTFGAATDISMVGLSGGGWTTHLAAAIDPRIRRSVPVAGATTLAVRNADPRSLGDPEQFYVPLYDEDIAEDGTGGGVATWVEIFALGGYGRGRRQVMVTAEFDNCCFAGRHADGFRGAVSRRVEELGHGSWSHVLDSSHHGHEISPWILDTVFPDVFPDAFVDAAAGTAERFPPESSDTAIDRALALSALDPSRLVAWCIVPFDAAKRGPLERVAMLRRLGLTRVAYDWREEHVPTFEAEIRAYLADGVELFAFWDWHDSLEPLIRAYGVRPQIWKMFPSPEGTQEERVERAARDLLPLAHRTRRLGCRLGLYNHGGWSGEPANLVAVAERLHAEGQTHVGIVYNLHHGHEHIADFESALRSMAPHLFCLDLNGMNDGAEPKILPIGQGSHDAELLRIIVESGYPGPFGVLDHRPELDAEESLRANLDGLSRLLGEVRSLREADAGTDDR